MPDMHITEKNLYLPSKSTAISLSHESSQYQYVGRMLDYKRGVSQENNIINVHCR